MFASGLSVHVDTDVYADPPDFGPERFLDAMPNQYSFNSFSTGRHRCPGRSFFATEAGLLLHRVFGRLDIEPSRPEIDRTYMDHGFFNRPKNKVPVVVRSRKAAGEIPVFRPTSISEHDATDVSRCPVAHAVAD